MLLSLDDEKHSSDSIDSELEDPDSSESESESSSSSSNDSQSQSFRDPIPDWITSTSKLHSLNSRGSSSSSSESALIEAHQTLDHRPGGDPIRWSRLLTSLKYLQSRGLLGKHLNIKDSVPSHQLGKKIKMQQKAGMANQVDSRQVLQMSLDRLISRLSLLLDKSKSDDDKLKAPDVHSKEYKRSLSADEARALSKVIQLCRPLFSSTGTNNIDVLSSSRLELWESLEEETGTLKLIEEQEKLEIEDGRAGLDLLSSRAEVETKFDHLKVKENPTASEHRTSNRIDTASSSILTSLEAFLLSPPSCKDLVLFIMERDQDFSKSKSRRRLFHQASFHLSGLLRDYVGGIKEIKQRFSSVNRLAIVESFSDEESISWDSILSTLSPFLVNLETLFINSKPSSTLAKLSKSKLKLSNISNDLKSSSKRSASRHRSVLPLPPSIFHLHRLSSISISVDVPTSYSENTRSHSVAREISSSMKKYQKESDFAENKRLPSLVSMAVQSFQASSASSYDNRKEETEISNLPTHLSKLVLESYDCCSCQQCVLSSSTDHISSFSEKCYHLNPPISMKDTEQLISGYFQNGVERNGTSARRTEIIVGGSFHSFQGEVEDEDEGNLRTSLLPQDWRFCKRCAALHLFSSKRKESLGIRGEFCGCFVCRDRMEIVKRGGDIRWWRTIEM